MITLRNHHDRFSLVCIQLVGSFSLEVVLNHGVYTFDDQLYVHLNRSIILLRLFALWQSRRADWRRASRWGRTGWRALVGHYVMALAHGRCVGATTRVRLATRSREAMLSNIPGGAF